METEVQDQRSNLIRLVQEKRKRVEAIARKLRKSNSLFVYLSIIASALATLLAGLTAMMGPLAGSGLADTRALRALAEMVVHRDN